jgi:PAS domain S-box-containing protein
METPPDRTRILYVDGPDVDTPASLDRFDVVRATGVDDALDRLPAEQVACVVAANDLPDSTGIDLLERLRDREPTLPFVLVAADGSEALASRAVAAGASGYVPTGGDADDTVALADRVADTVEDHPTRPGAAGPTEGADTPDWELTPAEYRDVFVKAEVGIGITDPETGRFEQVNRRWAEMLGYDLEAMYGKTVAEVSADDPRFDQAAAMERIQAAVDGTPQQFDWLHERADGSTVWCEVNLKRTVIGGEPRLLAFLREVADRKERERELQFLEAMIESVGVGVAAYEEDGAFAYVNPRYAEMLDTDRETLLGAKAWEVTPDIDRETFDANWSTIDVGETRTAETVHEFEGERVDVETVTTCAEIGGTTYHFGTVRDISAHKQQERRYRAFVEQSNDILTLMDESGVYQYQSPSVERILGYEPDELVGRSAFEFVHPGDRERVMAKFQRLIEGTKDLEVEYRFRHADGSWRWLSSRGANQLGDTDGEEYVVNSRDVTERKERERQIADLHDATREMVQASDEQALCEIAVETVETVLDHPIAGVWLADGSGERLEPVACTQSGRELVGELPVYTEGNSLSWRAYESGEPLIVDDTDEESGLYNPDTPVASELIVPLGEYGVLNIGSREPDAFDDNDVTLVKLLAANAEVALDRSERESQLERQTEQMEFFNSILRHDVLNAVTVIKGRAEFLAADLEGQQLEDVETIVRWSDDVTEIVQRVRTVLETLTREGDPELEPMDLGAELRAEIERVRATYPEVEFEATIPGGTTVLANELLGDVLGNVVTNAIEHNDTEGLRVSTAVERDDDGVSVRIADNGQGVDDDRKEAIFRRGETGHAKSIGSGFGLFFADAMIEEYGGEMWVEDNDAGGATFVVHLPAVDAGSA